MAKEEVNTIIKVNSEPDHPSVQEEIHVGDHHLPSRPIVSIKLKKTVYENKTAGNFIDKEFSELYKTKMPVDIELFFNIYKKLFYKINKDDDKKSHYFLIRKSKEYINNYYDPLDDEIKSLINKIQKLDQIFFDKSNPSDNSHLFYPNRTFLKTIVTNPDGLPIWVMQDGAKRQIENYQTYQTLKRAFGHMYDTPDDFVCEKLDINSLDDILDGPPIKEDKDLTTQEFDIVNLDITLGDLVDPGYIKAKITCLEGKEDPEGLAPFLPSHYEKRYESCYYQVEAFNLGSEENIMLEDASGPGEIRISSRRLFPGDSHTTFYRKEGTWHNRLRNVEGFIKEEIIIDSNRMPLGCCGTPAVKENMGHWKDKDGHHVRYFYDLPGIPSEAKVYRYSEYGTKMIQPKKRDNDLSWYKSFADHGWWTDNQGDWKYYTQDHLWYWVLHQVKNKYYDTSINWVDLAKSVLPQFGKYFTPLNNPHAPNSIYGLPILSLTGGSDGFYSWNGPHPGKYSQTYMVPLGVDKTPFFKDRYLFVLVDNRIKHITQNKQLLFSAYAKGKGSVWGSHARTMWNLTERKDFSENNSVTYNNKRKIQLLAYPGFDNWSYVGWNQDGDQFYGKGGNSSLIV